MNEKLITFCIPCYNSEAYMTHAIDSLLIGGEEVEIIIIDDGSKDLTGEIADSYQMRYPSIVKAVHQPNGGHGAGVNHGLALAHGLYYKVVDSDDWADPQGYRVLLDTLRKHYHDNTLQDLYLMDFLYNKPSHNKTFRRDYRKQFVPYKSIGWDEVKSFDTDEVLMMHALFYKTSVLKKSGLKLPEHTFYVDDIYAYTPLPYCQSIFYIPEIFYMYFIGREDQSVSMNNIIKRYDQQIRVFKELYQSFSYRKIQRFAPGLRKYMLHYLNVMTVMTLMFTTGENTPERKKAVKDLWAFMKRHDKELYRFLRYRGYTVFVNFLGFSLRGYVLKTGYKLVRKKQAIG